MWWAEGTIKMHSLTHKLSIVTIGLILALAAIATLPLKAAANDSGESQVAQADDSADIDESENSSLSYSYTAQKGDSFSLIARKAVQTYGLINNVNLSQAQIIAAETYLTQASGSPALNQGQAVSVNVSEVKSSVEKAQALSQDAATLWQKYVSRANFNTDNVGEARS
jgi:hypothetical protein